jgi:prevent-host-death family protein
MRRIGVRELRQHASRYLALVARGEHIEITDRGRPVARLVPVRGSAWEDLLASGRVQPPVDDGDIADEEPVDYGIDATAELQAMRALER